MLDFCQCELKLIHQMVDFLYNPIYSSFTHLKGGQIIMEGVV